jgi:hypothetical protein
MPYTLLFSRTAEIAWLGRLSVRGSVGNLLELQRQLHAFEVLFAPTSPQLEMAPSQYPVHTS